MRTSSQLANLSRVAAFAATALLAAAQVQARELVWSVGVGNAPPVWQQPRVVAVPQSVYLPPAPVYGRPPMVVISQPYVVSAPAGYYVQPAWQQPYYDGRGWGQHHRHHGFRGYDGWRRAHDQGYGGHR